MLHLTKALKMPSQTKLYTLPDGWMSKETQDGHNGFYHQSLFRPKKWYEQVFNKDGVATVYSDGWTKVRASRMTAPNLQAGVKRVIIWDFASLPAAGIADIYVLGKLYIGDRVIGGLRLAVAVVLLWDRLLADGAADHERDDHERQPAEDRRFAVAGTPAARARGEVLGLH